MNYVIIFSYKCIVLNYIFNQPVLFSWLLSYYFLKITGLNRK